jgi:anti-sigma B factor antagonist
MRTAINILFMLGSSGSARMPARNFCGRKMTLPLRSRKAARPGFDLPAFCARRRSAHHQTAILATSRCHAFLGPTADRASMKITISEFEGAVTRVTLVGKLDLAGAEAIKAPLATMAAAAGRVVVDMAGVDFIASVGIRRLVLAAEAIARHSGKLVLFRPTPLVAEVLLTLGLEKLLPIARSEEEVRVLLVGPANS